jgi:hypothetical protein
MDDNERHEIMQRSRDTLARLEQADREREHRLEQQFSEPPPDPRDGRAWTAWLNRIAPPEPAISAHGHRIAHSKSELQMSVRTEIRQHLVEKARAVLRSAIEQRLSDFENKISGEIQEAERRIEQKHQHEIDRLRREFAAVNDHEG